MLFSLRRDVGFIAHYFVVLPDRRFQCVDNPKEHITANSAVPLATISDEMPPEQAYGGANEGHMTAAAMHLLAKNTYSILNC